MKSDLVLHWIVNLFPFIFLGMGVILGKALWHGKAKKLEEIKDGSMCYILGVIKNKRPGREDQLLLLINFGKDGLGEQRLYKIEANRFEFKQDPNMDKTKIPPREYQIFIKRYNPYDESHVQISHEPHTRGFEISN